LWSLVNSKNIEFCKIKDITLILADLFDEKEAVLLNYLKIIKNHVNSNFEMILTKYQES
jgi:hypothetical protein